MNKDNFVILDIETNVEENTPIEEHFHVIQIGATKITNGDFNNYNAFDSFIRPVNNLQYPSGGETLTPFIKKLTKITQEQVDNAPIFQDVWDSFLRFCAPYYCFFASWGKYDWDVLKKVCDYYSLDFPFTYHVNIKDYYRAYFKDQEVQMGMGVKAASEYFGLPFDTNTAHNGFKDAESITAIARVMSERGFYTFKKAYYEMKDGKIVPAMFSNYLINPAIVKRYKEIQKKAREMEQFLFANS